MDSKKNAFDAAKCAKLIQMMGEGASITEVAASLEVRRQYFYEWSDPDSKRYDAQFAEAFDLAREASQSWWERLGRKLASGETKGNAATWIFTMKNRFSEDYRDSQETVHEFSGQPSQFVMKLS